MNAPVNSTVGNRRGGRELKQHLRGRRGPKALLSRIRASRNDGQHSAVDSRLGPAIPTTRAALELCGSILPNGYTFCVEAGDVIWGYGFRHTLQSHPWVAYLAGSLNLERFYAAYSHSLLHDLLFPSLTNVGARLPPFDTLIDPNLEIVIGERALGPMETVGEVSLSREHGTQHRGPLSTKKLRMEAKNLNSLHDAIRRNGYCPPVGDGIRGYFIISEGSFAFRLTGGQHRAAVLAYLGMNHLPVTFEPSFPRFVDARYLTGDAAVYADALLSDATHQSKCEFLATL